MAFKHGSKATFRLDNNAGALQDLSTYISSVGMPVEMDTASIDVMGGPYSSTQSDHRRTATHPRRRDRQVTGRMAQTPGRQHGGPVKAGFPYIVGEAGRELFIPRASGRIIPNGGGMASVAGGVIENHITVLLDGRKVWESVQR